MAKIPVKCSSGICVCKLKTSLSGAIKADTQAVQKMAYEEKYLYFILTISVHFYIAKNRSEVLKYIDNLLVF